MKLKRWLRALGVLAILFHLIVIVLIPNRESYLTQVLGPILNPYANMISLNMAWQFFSPDPGLAVYIMARVQKDTETLFEEYLPPEKDEFFFRTFFDRRNFAMRYASRSPENAHQILIPWLCQKFPEATSVHLDKIILAVPSLEAVRAGMPLNDPSAKTSYSLASQDCDRGELVE